MNRLHAVCQRICAVGGVPDIRCALCFNSYGNRLLLCAFGRQRDYGLRQGNCVSSRGGIGEVGFFGGERLNSQCMLAFVKGHRTRKRIDRGSIGGSSGISAIGCINVTNRAARISHCHIYSHLIIVIAGSLRQLGRGHRLHHRIGTGKDIGINLKTFVCRNSLNGVRTDRERKIIRELRHLCGGIDCILRVCAVGSVEQRTSIRCIHHHSHVVFILAALGRDFRCAENGQRISGSAFLIRGICLRGCRNLGSTRATSQGHNALARHSCDRLVVGRIRFDGYAVGVFKLRLRKRTVSGNGKRRGRIRNFGVCRTYCSRCVINRDIVNYTHGGTSFIANSHVTCHRSCQCYGNFGPFTLRNLVESWR